MFHKIIDCELERFVDLVITHKTQFGKQKVDAVIASFNNKTCEILCKKFNSQSLNGYQQEKCMRSKYDNLKKSLNIKLRDVKSKCFA